ncbi:hypothetical protein QN277_028377 [Acacia crassicarpa]|uniref:Uncharacterized protein n=1 Tax=Acacia crassicarpa TaxID=499986 RepID=A0AAE1J4P2_9FABA|nr:hypothetical protein QN277_028377 [Acacia crassicarpa]
MASDFASFTVLFCLLCFSTLSMAVDLPAIDKTSRDLLPESNTKSGVVEAIFLPSERLESESAPVIESQPEISDSKISKPVSEVETSKLTESSEASDSIPITTITFRPINRHMPWRQMRFPARPGHRCRHNHKFKPWNPRLPRHQIPYGNDMILSNGQENNFDVLPDDRVPKIPMRWTTFGRFESQFTDEPGMERIKEVMTRRYRYHHERDHDDEHDHHRERDHDDEHDHRHERDHDDEHDHRHERDHDDEHDHRHERDHDDEHDHRHERDHDDEHDHHHDHKHDHDHDDEHDHHHERDHDDEHDHHHDHDHKHDHDHNDEHDHHHDHDHDDENDHHHDHDHKHDHQPHHKHEHDREHDHHHERDHEEGGLMKSIRKFLQHF